MHDMRKSLMPFAMLILVFLSLWIWYGWRIEPRNGEIAILVRKTGRNLPPEAILAPGPGYKGIQEDVLPEGRYFRNPWDWEWRYAKAVDIPAGKFGVLVRKFGDDLPEGEILAREGTRGILPDVLGTGKHRINPYAYEVKLYDDITIKPGHVGVVTELTGDDILAPGGAKASTTGTAFLIEPGAKGVSAKILKEGTHRLNPFVYSVSIVNIQSQRFELSGADAITFLTQDGFTVNAEGTLEFNLEVDKVALLSHEVGDMDDILQKIVLPAARGFSRIEGSKKSATEFIVGESRQAFQDSLETYLKGVCKPWGVSLNSVLIRDIFAPQEVAGIIRQRELAVQEGLKIDQQIVQAKSQAELERQKALAAQSSEKVAAETEREVAAVELESARADAEARLTAAEAERKVVEARTKAEADVLRQEVAAYGGEEDYVRAMLYEKAAPRVTEVITGDAPGEIFGLPTKAVREGGAQ